LLLIIVTALLPRRAHWSYLVPAVILLAAWPFARMPLGYTIRRLLVVEFFILGLGLFSWWHPPARAVFISALIKSHLCVVAMLMLTWTTPFHLILQELRRLRLPAAMVTTLALMYRYLPVLQEESRRMQRARLSRTFGQRRPLAWHSLATIIGQLFIRSVDRAERIYLAMCARGWK
jgi:cobalt/nickel transport system permease protein